MPLWCTNSIALLHEKCFMYLLHPYILWFRRLLCVFSFFIFLFFYITSGWIIATQKFKNIRFTSLLRRTSDIALCYPFLLTKVTMLSKCIWSAGPSKCKLRLKYVLALVSIGTKRAYYLFRVPKHPHFQRPCTV